MRTYLNTYNIYKQGLTKIKQQLSSGNITPQEARERTTAEAVNLSSIISSIEYVYPNDLVDNLRNLVDKYEKFKSSIKSNNQSQQENIQTL